MGFLSLFSLSLGHQRHAAIAVGASIIVLTGFSGADVNAEGAGNDVTITPRSAQKATEIGAVLEPFKIHPGQYVSAWCMISTGKLRQDGSRVVDLVPGGVGGGFAKNALRRLIGHEKGDVMCAGRVATTPVRIINGWRPDISGDRANASLSLNYKYWADGAEVGHKEHPCWTKAQCVNYERSDTPDDTDALSACIEVKNRDTDEIGSVVLVIENEDDDTVQKMPAAAKSDVGYKGVACASRSY